MNEALSTQPELVASPDLRSRMALLLDSMRSEWRFLLLILVLALASSFSAALQPLPLKVVADYALGASAAPSWARALIEGAGLDVSARSLIVLAAVMSLALTALGVVLSNGLTLLWESAGQRMVFALTVRTFDHLQRLSLGFHHVQPVGDSMSRLMTDTWAVYTGANTAFITPITRGVTIATIGIAAWSLDAELATVMLLTVPVLVASAGLIGRVINRQSYRARAARSRVSAFAQQTLAALPLVKAFGTEAQNRRRFVRLAEEAASAAERQVLVNRFFSITNGMTLTIATAVILYVGSVRVIDGALTLGTLLVFVAYVRTLDQQLRGVLNLYGQFRAAEAGLDRVLELLSQEITPPEPTDPVDFPWEVTRGRAAGVAGSTASLKRVTFGYEPGRPVLRDVNIEVAAGESVALVGRTGSGKTTLVSLIARLYDPWEGTVEVDGIDVRRVRHEQLRRRIAVVSQSALLLPLSVAENIAYARPDATRQEVRRAAVAANADEFIRALPDGYDTVVGERGADLSGGQRQRLAIARALLKDAPLLILDEPTSSLDRETEQTLLEAMDRLQRDRTTIVIAHRLGTVRGADRIVVLENGEVAEEGSHEALLAADGIYAHFRELQASGRNS